MRQWLRWGLPVILAAGMNVNVLRASDDEDDTSAKPKPAASSPRASTWSSWFGGKSAPPKKAATKSAKKDKDDVEKTAPKVDPAIAERKREENVYLRRNQVCLKLLEVADETNDDDLRHMAERLEELSQTAYSQRVAHLPAGQASLPTDRQVLDKHLGDSTTAVSGATKSLTYGVSGKEPQAQTAIREEKP